jgi:Spy/CpxP family protein refolding chaperone
MPRLPARVGVTAVLTLSLLTLSGTPARGDEPARDKGPATQPKLGLSINSPKAFQGYTLLASMSSTKTYLIDLEGKVVRTWESNSAPGLSTYLLENGHLLRAGMLGKQPFGGGPGAGGRIQEYTWEGELVWDFQLASDKQLPHHDICRLPSGNVLLIAWDKKTAKEAVAAGRKPEFVGDSHLQPDCILEVKPTGKTTGEVVWEWHIWDHLVQDHDKAKANFGDVAAHPELIDVNYGEGLVAAMVTKKDDLDKLKGIGYVGGTPGNRPARINPDWTHINAVAYNADLDQIVLSVHAFSEIWIIDHSTTRAEAAGHSGGKSGKGGDLLYRWGNPRAYRAGKAADQRLFSQHNAHWIAKGLPGEGHLLVFNNGNRRPDGDYSSVDEIVLPVDAEGRYEHKPGTAFGPDKAVWSYTAAKKSDFFSMLISGAQRLPNGNTLICSGFNGTIFEVTPEKEVVWKYVNPVKGGMGPGGFGGFGGPPQSGQVLPGFLQDMLKLTAEQKKQAAELQKEVDGKLDKLLTDEQKKQLKEPQGFGPGGFGTPPQPGQVLPASLRDKLKLTDEQKKQAEELQKEVDGKLDKLLTEEQRKQLKEPFRGFGFPPGPPGGFGPPVRAGGPSQPGQVLPAFLHDVLGLTADQKKQLEEFQKEIDGKLGKVLTDEQKKQLKEPPRGFGFGAPPQPGQLMSPFQQATLKMTADQKKEVEELQKEVDGKLDKLFTDDQKKKLKDMRAGVPGRPGGPGFGPPGGASLFRAYRYGPEFPGLKGKDLTPGKTVEELQPKEPEKKK